jgi:hypothetical protein
MEPTRSLKQAATPENYLEVIARKAELLKNLLNHCASSDMLLWGHVHIQDILHAVEELRKRLA